MKTFGIAIGNGNPKEMDIVQIPYKEAFLYLGESFFVHRPFLNRILSKKGWKVSHSNGLAASHIEDTIKEAKEAFFTLMKEKAMTREGLLAEIKFVNKSYMRVLK